MNLGPTSASVSCELLKIEQRDETSKTIMTRNIYDKSSPTSEIKERANTVV
jgi:hypothetical protein